jgi:hypothetical protein
MMRVEGTTVFSLDNGVGHGVKCSPQNVRG